MTQTKRAALGRERDPQSDEQLDQRLSHQITATQGATQEACILGVDPGLSGALAFLFPRHDRITADDMPTVGGDVDAATLAARIRQMAPTCAIIEIASARPKQGVSSVFRYGAGYGAVIGVIAALAIPVHLVSATKWKRHFNLDSDKERSRALALRLWPSRADLFGRKRDHGRSEAALIARYGAETVIRSSP